MSGYSLDVWIIIILSLICVVQRWSYVCMYSQRAPGNTPRFAFIFVKGKVLEIDICDMLLSMG